MKDETSLEDRKTISAPMHRPLRHDSAHKHVAGTADYIDDRPEPEGTLHAALGTSDRAHAKIVSMDLSAVRASASAAPRRWASRRAEHRLGDEGIFSLQSLDVWFHHCSGLSSRGGKGEPVAMRSLQ